MGNPTFSVCERCYSVNKVDLAETTYQSPICGKCKVNLPIDGYLSNLTTRALQKLIQKSPITVVVDFWASWCGPCGAFSPVFADMARRYEGKLVFVKIDTEANKEATTAYGVKGIPTLIFFKKGQEVQRHAGALLTEPFRALLEKNL